MTDSNTLHFLDTSIARHLLLSSSYYKAYLKEQLGEDTLYISTYVQMEFNRGYLCVLIDFYFLLRVDTIKTIGDALKLWSEEFSSASHKSVEIMIGELLETRSLSKTNLKDKNKALKTVGRYIKRIYLLFNESYKDIGINATRCHRTTIKLSDSSCESITNFKEGFENITLWREKCKIDDFILKSYLVEIEKYINLAEKLSAPKDRKNKGFVRITDELKKIKEKNGANLTCKTCAKIGDAVISLEMPQTMRLETLDSSFNHLVPPIGKSHIQHLSQKAIHKDGKPAL